MSKKSYLFCILILFIAIYYPPVVSFNLIHAAAICAWIYCGLHLSAVLKVFINKNVFTITAINFLMLIYIFLVSTYYSTSLKSAVMDSFMWLFEIIPIGIMLSVYGKRQGIKTEQFINIIIDVAFIQGILSIVNFYVPAFHNWVISRMMAYGYHEGYVYMGTYRLYGMAHSLTFFMPIVQTLMMLMAMYYYNNNKIKYLIYIIVLFFSAIINARTPIVIMLVGIVFLWFIKLFRREIRIRKHDLIATFVVAVIAGLGIYQLYANVLQGSNIFQNWIKAGFDSILLFLQGENIGYFSYFDEGDRFILPTGFKLIFGIGKDTLTSGGITGVYTDVGYVNYLWFGGIIYTALLFALFLKMIFSLIKSGNNALFFLGINLLADVFFLNIKGILFAVNEFTTVLFIIAIYYYLNKTEVDHNNGMVEVNYEKSINNNSRV